MDEKEKRPWKDFMEKNKDYFEISKEYVGVFAAMSDYIYGFLYPPKPQKVRVRSKKRRNRSQIVSKKSR